jgi:RNA polymerase sigma-32 factor
LAREEEGALLRDAGQGDAEALLRLVEAHFRYVVAIARRYRGWGLPMGDLLQEGTLGLIEAVHRFRPEHGTRLSTYAVWRIRSAIQNYALRSWSLVRLGSSNTQRMLALRLRRISTVMTTADGAGSAAGPDERWDVALARRFSTTAAEVSRLAARMRAPDCSLDLPNAAGAPVRVLADDAPTPEEALAEKSEKQMIRAALAAAIVSLPPREQLVIRRRYFDEVRQTFETIGRELGVSKDRARQLEVRALAKLADLLRPTLAEVRS